MNKIIAAMVLFSCAGLPALAHATAPASANELEEMRDLADQLLDEHAFEGALILYDRLNQWVGAGSAFRVEHALACLGVEHCRTTRAALVDAGIESSLELWDQAGTLADALAARGRMADRERLLRNYLRRHPREPAARRTLGYALLQDGRRSEALSELETYVAEQPGDFDVRLDALELLEQTRGPKARDLALQQWLLDAPRCRQAWLVAAEIAIDRKELPSARHALQQARQAEPTAAAVERLAVIESALATAEIERDSEIMTAQKEQERTQRILRLRDIRSDLEVARER